MRPIPYRRLGAVLAVAVAFGAVSGCGKPPEGADAHDAHAQGAGAHEAAEDFERGPHRGRLLRAGDLSLEIAIFEDGVPPEFHVYAYRKGKPIDPAQVRLVIELSRLGGRVDRIGFTPQGDFLRGDGVVREPHSFDVKVNAVEGRRAHAWTYASYEGRTTLTPAAATAGGVKTEVAGPAAIPELVTLAGRVEITPEGQGDVRAWYPGRIVAMTASLGQRVRKGQVIARVESSHSLQTYAIPAPIGGVVVRKNANVGDVANDQALYAIADPTQLHAEFFVYPRDAERVREGQIVEVRNLTGDVRVVAAVEAILPTVDLTNQTLIAHVHLPRGADAAFRAGMGVEGTFQVATRQAALAVKTKAIQRFRDASVVFAKVGDTYELRMLELGRQTPEWTEVLSGLDAGTAYVTDGAFLIRADIEKSGASHDH